jgi:hypothetical protein
MHRLHEDDLVGHVLAQEDWDIVSFPAIAENSSIVFERDEPFCMIFPLKRGFVEEVEPEMRALETDPEVSEAYLAWADSRRIFNTELQLAGSPAHAQKWQKDYFRGKVSFGTAPADHRTKVKLREFKLAQ